MSNTQQKFLPRLLHLAVFLMVMAAAAIVNSGKVLGHDLTQKAEAEAAPQATDTLSVAADGSMVVNTTPLGKDVNGYGGPVPLKVHISKDGKVTQIEALANSETPDFFDQAKSLFKQWEGKTVSEARAMKVDAVSGATFSSEAIKANVALALAYADKVNAAAGDAETTVQWQPDVKWGVTLVVVLLGAIVPLYKKSRKWHFVQQVLNVAVLGLWSGTFLSYTLWMNLMSNGLTLTTTLTLLSPLVMMIAAFVYPLFGKPKHYCAHICPMGSAQDLMGRISPRKKWQLGPKWVKRLTMFRQLLWAVLLVLLVSGVYAAWIDYELFTAFLIGSTMIWVEVQAALVLLLAIMVPRPYCRFVCPTGMWW